MYTRARRVAVRLERLLFETADSPRHRECQCEQRVEMRVRVHMDDGGREMRARGVILGSSTARTCLSAPTCVRGVLDDAFFQSMFTLPQGRSRPPPSPREKAEIGGLVSRWFRPRVCSIIADQSEKGLLFVTASS